MAILNFNCGDGHSAKGARPKGYANLGLLLGVSLALIGIAVWWVSARRPPNIRLELQRSTAQPASSPPNLPQITICKTAEWNINNPTPDSILYGCKSQCEGDWRACMSPDSGDGNSSSPTFEKIAGVVDDIGFELRWSKPDPGGPKAVLFIAGGKTGTEFIDTSWYGSLFDELRSAGVQTVTLKWAQGVQVPPSDIPQDRITQFYLKREGGQEFYGWLSRKDGSPSTYRSLSARPAAVIKWVHDNLTPPGEKFGTFACSGGTDVNFSPVYWYQLNDIVDYQFLSGGPILWDVNAACTREADPPGGLCENDPSRMCSSDSNCGGGRNRCAFPSEIHTGGLPDVLREYGALTIDYVHRSGDDCRAGRGNQLFKESSYRFTGGNWNMKGVDFDIGEGFPVPKWFPPVGDTEGGITYQVGKIYQAVQSSAKTWTDNDRTFHCPGLGPLSKQYVPAIKSRVLRGLGILPQSAASATGQRSPGLLCRIFPNLPQCQGVNNSGAGGAPNSRPFCGVLPNLPQCH